MPARRKTHFKPGKDLKAGLDPTQADITRRLSRIVPRMRKSLSAAKWAATITEGLLMPLVKEKDAEATVEKARLLIDSLEEWRWKQLESGDDDTQKGDD